MHRRRLLTTALASGLATTPPPALAATHTRWAIRGSEGFDALCFLGPLSGKAFYARYYPKELAAFALPPDARAALGALQAASDARGALLAPGLCTLFSGGPDATLDGLIASLDRAETVLLPPLRKSDYWDAESWAAFLAGRPQLRTVLEGLRTAGFPAFRNGLIEARLTARRAALGVRLDGLDVIAEQERLLGRRLQPGIEIVLLWFSQPHGIRIQGQRFLSHVAYPDDVVIRIAAHEIFHPPFAMDGPAGKAALNILGRDDLLKRVVAEHDPAFGYNSLEGLLNEGVCQALDQIVSERLGFGRDPADRWRKADGGMHILAAGLYGLLKADGYDRTGGRLERWVLDAAKSGELAPTSLHPAAALVMGLPLDKLWTPPPKA